MAGNSDNSNMREGTTKTSSDGRRQFKLTRRIGLGGFGEVYLAEMSTSSGFTKTVALKLLRADVEGAGDNARRMRDEARLLGLLRHRAIVQADDLITIDGRTAVIMEYIPGANLSDLLDESRFPHPLAPNLGLELTAEIADAMDAAWSRPSEVTSKPLEVLHRDIKPGNVRITPDGQVKILDFGIARADQMDRETATRDYAVGSLPYMAPELLVGHGATPGSDVYALGVTFLETLTRRRFGIAQDTVEGHDARLTERLGEIDIEELNPCRDEVVQIIAQMMAFESEKRPSAREVARRLREILHSLHLPSLQAWARDSISKVNTVDSQEPEASMSRDDMSGRIFFEDIASKADTWDGDTMGLSQESARPTEVVSEDKNWIWKTALIALLGLVVVLGYRLLDDSGDVAVPSDSSSSQGAAQTGAVDGARSDETPRSPTDATTADPGTNSIEGADVGADVSVGSTEGLSEESLPIGSSDVGSATAPPAIEVGDATPDGDGPDPAMRTGRAPGEDGDPVDVGGVSEPEPDSVIPTMATVKIKSAPKKSVPFLLDGQRMYRSESLQTPKKISIESGSHELICDPQGTSFSATIAVPDEGGTWICNTTLRAVQGP